MTLHQVQVEPGIRPTILVITDQFRPDIVGGAELSLEASLLPLVEKGYRIHVAALSRHVREVALEQHGPLPVYRIPFSQVWPPQRDMPVGTALPLTNGGGRPDRLLRQAMRFLVARGGTRAWSRIANVGRAAVVATTGYNKYSSGVDRDLVEMPSTGPLLRQLAVEVSPDLVHADNLYSILFATSFLRRIAPLVGFVRESRFFCSHITGAASVGRKPCATCQYDCLAHLPVCVRHSLRRILRQNRDYRHERLRQLDHIVVASAYMLQQLSHIAPMSRVTVVPNPVGDFARSATRGAPGSAATPPEILSVGSLVERKGPLELVELLPDLKRELGAFRVVFVGNGLLDAEIERRAREKGLSEAVQLLGPLDRRELALWYRRAAVVVCPAISPEPFGRVPLEAAGFEKPAICYDIGGYRETIIDGQTGILVPHGDRAAFLRAVVRLVRNPHEATEMGQRARDYVLQKFSDEHSSSGLEKVWRQSIHISTYERFHQAANE